MAPGSFTPPLLLVKMMAVYWEDESELQLDTAQKDKHHVISLILCVESRKVKLTGAESRLVVPRGWVGRVGEIGSKDVRCQCHRWSEFRRSVVQRGDIGNDMQYNQVHLKITKRIILSVLTTQKVSKAMHMLFSLI